MLKVLKQTNEQELELVMKPYFREHYSTIFTSAPDPIMTQVMHELLYILSIDDQSTVEACLSYNEDDIKGFITAFKNLWLYMRLAEPRVTLDLTLYNDKVLAYAPEKYTIVDGFEKDEARCIIVMNAPMLSYGSFAGIKPAVIILSPNSADFSE